MGCSIKDLIGFLFPSSPKSFPSPGKPFGAFLRLGQTPPVACGDSPLKEGAFPGGKASGSGAKLPVSPEPPSLREVANPQGLTEGVRPAPGLFVSNELTYQLKNNWKL